MKSIMDYDKLRAEVGLRHNVMLGKDDPILVTVTIHEMVLSRYVEELEKQGVETQKAIAIALQQNVEKSRESAGKIITEAADYVSRQVREAVSAAVVKSTTEAGTEMRRFLDDSRAAAKSAERAERDSNAAAQGVAANVRLAQRAAIAAALAAGAAAIAAIAVILALVAK
jgi:ABC-type multidrug transport system fused ATPase/permease subunit